VVQEGGPVPSPAAHEALAGPPRSLPRDACPAPDVREPPVLN